MKIKIRTAMPIFFGADSVNDCVIATTRVYVIASLFKTVKYLKLLNWQNIKHMIYVGHLTYLIKEY